MVLVTGGSGLVGQHLIALLLQKGKRVRGLYNTSQPSMVHENLEWEQADILDVLDIDRALLGVNQVYHCAATVSFHSSDKQQLYKTNVSGTTNIVNACIDAAIDKLVYVSSVAVLGRSKPNILIDETQKWEEKNSSYYGKTKHLAEMEVWRGTGEGLKAVIVNPSIILGAADWTKGSAGIFKSVYNEFPWVTNGGTGFVDVVDVVNAMHQLMESNIEGQRFILNGHNLSYRTLFTQIAQSFDKKPPHKTVTPLIAALVWRFEAIKTILTGKKPLLTKETAHTAQQTIRYSNQKILGALPNFTFTPYETSIKRICAELKERYRLSQ